jgi:hypothetical protein
VRLPPLLFKQDCCCQTTHYLYPKGSSPRFLLPKNKAAVQVGLHFFLPYLRRNKFWIKNVFNFYRKPQCGTFSEEIRDTLTLTTADVELCTMAIGIPGPYQKYTVLQLDRQLIYLTISKIGTNEATYKLLINEAAKLQWLNEGKRLAEHTPTLLKKKNKHDLYVIKESVGEGLPVLIKRDYGNICDFLHLLHLESGKQICFARSNVFRLLHDRYARLKSLLTIEWQQRAEYYLQQLTRLDSHKFRFVLAHRDFAEWNMCLTPKGLYVFDWEYAQFGYPPLYDLFHLHLITKAVRGKLHNKYLYSILHGRHVSNYIDSGYELPIHYQLVIYLLDLCLFYLESNNGKDEGDIVVQQYAAMLDLLNKEMRIN